MNDPGQRISGMSPLKLAFAAQQLESSLHILKAEPIAVVGLGCRFPGGADSPDAYWNLLRDGVDAIAEIPPERWDMKKYYSPDPDAPGKMYCRHGGFLESVDTFDARFFSISPREAAGMDPQQRLLMEVSWEALEHANQRPDDLFGVPAGVFVGISTSDYAAIRVGLQEPSRIDPYFVSGSVLSVAAGRLSYALGLTGPSMAVDTACSSSLVAMHLACESLRRRECRLALAGGVGLILAPEPHITFSKARMLSSHGRCKTFDAAADGYVRGDGCGMIILKRLSDAVADGDHILALIRGTAINQDGSSGGLTVPSGPSQERVIRQALACAGIRPDQVSYVEAHGTGTSLGDPIEMGALGNVFCNPPRNRPLMVGSVKTNFGHLEAAAGVAGLVKIVLALQHGEIPPHLHFKEPNPRIDWERLQVEIPAECRNWPDLENRRIAGVSSFGFAGTNAHVVIEEFRDSATRDSGSKTERPLHLLTLSAKTQRALNQLAERYEKHLAGHPHLALADICFTANTCRCSFSHRLAVVAASLDELQEKLSDFRAARACAGVFSGQAAEEEGETVHGLHTLPPSDQSPQGWQGFFEELGAFYVRGGSVDWHMIERDYFRGKVHLPTYPFQRERYWVDTSPPARPGPCLIQEDAWKPPGRRINLPFSKEVRFESQFRASSPSYLEDHKLFGTRVVAGASHVSMVLEAGKALFGHDPCVVEDMLFQAPLVIPDGCEQTVQLICDPIPDRPGDFFFKLVSTRIDDQPGSNSDQWHQHVSGKLKKGSDGESSAMAFNHLQEIQDRGTTIEGQDFYAEILEQGHHLGTSFQWIEKIWWHQQDGVCQMACPDLALDPYQLYPGLIDSCVQFFCIYGPRILFGESTEGLQDEAIYIPFAVDKISFFCPPRAGMGLKGHTRLRKDDGKGNSITGDMRLFDEKGAIVAEFTGFTARRLSREALESGLQEDRHEWLYAPSWQKGAAKTEELLVRDAPAGSWLIFSDKGGTGQKLAKLLEERGVSVTLVFAGDRPHLPGAYYMDPSDPEAFQRVMKHVAAQAQPHLEIVHLWCLDRDQETTLHSIEQSQVLGCGSVLHLVQALAETGLAGFTRLWLVTRGAQAVESRPVSLNLEHSTLWGLGRVISLEHPDMKCVRLDLDPAGDAEEVPLLFEQIWSPDGEDQMALRNGVRHVARLVRYLPATQKGASIHPDRSYLITGGLGALGLRVARRLVDREARYVVLTGRRAPSPAAQEAMTRMEGVGCTILALQADMARPDEVSLMLERIQRSMPPLAGIIHAAGIVDDALLIRQDLKGFKRVMAPKVDGAWNLHEGTRDMPLDFFVLFSSVASLLGSTGQGNYGAANAFMDALAHFRHTQGLPALTINWGAWAKIGMAAAMGEREQARLVSQGVGSIPPDEGLNMLERLMGQDVPQVGVLPVTWSKFMEQFHHGASPMFLEAFLPASESEGALWTQPSFMVKELKKTAPEKRRSVLEDHVRIQVAETLGMESPEEIDLHVGLFDVGIDSLMAVDLKSRLESSLGQALRSTLVFNYPTVKAMADYLADEVLPFDFPSESHASIEKAHHELGDDTDHLDSLSEEAMGQLLEEKLSRIESWTD
ncbi:MAG: SDR family NAD(P)-dependent oxidoreductase [Thermodesulfobacteriota bacterium]|nr:SDR family NAD(P)-dependent oxidoreductase [Thermodesulfobacteriota bacterium]